MVASCTSEGGKSEWSRQWVDEAGVEDDLGGVEDDSGVEDPERNFSFSWAMISGIFLPIALRTISASPKVYPAKVRAMCKT